MSPWYLFLKHPKHMFGQEFIKYTLLTESNDPKIQFEYVCTSNFWSSICRGFLLLYFLNKNKKKNNLSASFHLHPFVVLELLEPCGSTPNPVMKTLETIIERTRILPALSRRSANTFFFSSISFSSLSITIPPLSEVVQVFVVLSSLFY